MLGNPRFPHTCTIYRIEGVSAFSEGTKQVLYKGECRKYSGYRATDPDGVAKEIFALSIPIVYRMDNTYKLSHLSDAHNVEVVNMGIKPSEGDVVEITSPMGTFEGRITQVMMGNFGTTIHWEDVKR